MSNLINLKQLNTSQIKILLDLAKDMKHIIQAKNKKGPQMLGRTMVCISDEKYDFTPISLAFQYLGGTVIIAESFGDIIKAAKRYSNFGVSLIALKTKHEVVIKNISENIDCPILNICTETSNPIEALSTLSTLLFKLDTLENKNIAFLGYEKKSFVNELIYFLKKYKSNVFPFFPYDKSSFYSPETVTFKKIEHALSEADVIIDLGVRSKTEREEYYSDPNGITEDLLAKTKPEIALLGSRDYIVRGKTTAYPFNMVDRQEKDYLACCMAVLYYFYR
ncbi:MAG TPA: hypothetical protein PK675_02240 [Clostridia bacterium]|nr:hypothetical protein [Clostridia bacterium]